LLIFFKNIVSPVQAAVAMAATFSKLLLLLRTATLSNRRKSSFLQLKHEGFYINLDSVFELFI
jgi:hypothetical protein